MDRNALKTLVLSELSAIAPEVEPNQVPEHEDMREALDLDSMDFLNLIIAVGKQTGVKIPEADYGQVVSLDRLLDYLQTAGA